MAVCAIQAQAAAPSGYYSRAEGKTGQALLKALCDINASHTTVSYDGLWGVYQKADLTEDKSGFWDMYSTKVWPVNKERCGNYKYVGDCVNREHSFPKSWFNDASPMMSDAYHIYPTDGKVNGQRSNFPYGECRNGENLGTHNGVTALGKLGASTFSGYSGKVFEPDDRYKGDFARSYFYMAATYNSRVSSWNSDMLAGNNYPVFSKWAIDLLLKWHRQDPVSNKETVRNDEVSNFQKNRNPFIDYPELAEYIWGNKSGTPWYPGGDVSPEIVLPANGSTISLGYASTETAKTVQAEVKGVFVKDDLYVSVAGTGFSVSPERLSAADVNKGVKVNVTYSGNVAGKYAGTMTLESGELKTKVNLEVEVVSGLVAEEAGMITESSFVARWVNISGETAKYDLYVERNGEILSGYPVTVDAKDGFRRVDGVEAETTYSYYLTMGSLMSNRIFVTTSAAIPMIQLLYDDVTSISATTGIASDPVELLFETENITTEIKLEVAAPFEVSTDKRTWGRTLSLSTEEDRFYLRVNSEYPGTYITTIRMSAGDYVYDDVEFEGVVLVPGAGFIEDFEIGDAVKEGYDNGDFQGRAAKWYCNNLGVYKGDAAKAINGERSARFGKNSNSSLTMLEDKPAGLGIISFKTKKWDNDSDAELKAEYSTDGGNSWKTAGTASVTAKITEHAFTVNVTGNVRVRLVQTTGSRLFLDDIALTSYTSSVDKVKEDYHNWDAYCAGGRLIIENGEGERTFFVYSLDGIEVLKVTFSAGTREFNLAKGLYIIVCDDFARKVLVK